jgi:hypothetical protein
MDRDTEIAEIRRELDILRARHRLFARWGGILKSFVTTIVPLFAIALAVAGVMLAGADPGLATIFVVLTIVLCAIIYLIFTPRDPRRGWIDLASPAIAFAYPPRGLDGLIFGGRPSDALVIEEQMAERERRLLELGVSP